MTEEEFLKMQAANKRSWITTQRLLDEYKKQLREKKEKESENQNKEKKESENKKQNEEPYDDDTPHQADMPTSESSPLSMLSSPPEPETLSRVLASIEQSENQDESAPADDIDSAAEEPGPNVPLWSYRTKTDKTDDKAQVKPEYWDSSISKPGQPEPRTPSPKRKREHDDDDGDDGDDEYDEEMAAWRVSRRRLGQFESPSALRKERMDAARKNPRPGRTWQERQKARNEKWKKLMEAARAKFREETKKREKEREEMEEMERLRERELGLFMSHSDLQRALAEDRDRGDRTIVVRGGRVVPVKRKSPTSKSSEPSGEVIEDTIVVKGRR